MNRIKPKNNVEWLLFILVSIFISCMLFLTCFRLLKSQKITTYTDSTVYNENGSLTYDVCLFKNDYIGSECLSEKRSYVSSLVDKMKFKLKYSINASSKLDYTYSYKITGYVVANEKGDSSKLLYDNKVVFKDVKNQKITGSILSIEDTASIDFTEYNSIITSFKKNYVISVDSYMNVTCDIIINGKKDGIDEEINKSYTMTLKVPLAEQTVNIVENNTSISNSGEISQVVIKDDIYGARFFSRLIFVMTIFYIIIVSYIVIRYYPKLSTYKRYIKKILRTYDGIIVSVKKMVNPSNYELIEVNTFNELVDLKDNSTKAIIFYEDEVKGIAYFYLLDDKVMYLYLVKREDL